MNTDSTNTAAELYKETLERLWGAYEAGAQMLRTLLTGLLLFVIAFMAFMAYPYVGIQSRIAALRAFTPKLQQEKDKLAIQLAQLTKADFGPVRDRATAGRDELRDQVGRWYAANASEETMRANAREMILTQWTQMREQVQRLVPAVNMNWGEANSHVQRFLDEHPDFWKSYISKGEAFGELRQAVDDALAKAKDSLELKVPQFEKQLADIAAQLAACRDLQEQQSKRLKEINSPLGNLPIGLAESILVFPLIVAVGFVVSAFHLQRLVRLSNEIERLYRTRDESGQIVTEDRLDLMAPFSGIEWLQRRAGVLRLVLTAMPVLIYLAGVGMVLYSWSLSDDLLSVPGAGALYSALYLVAGCAVIYTWLTTARELRSSERMPSLTVSPVIEARV